MALNSIRKSLNKITAFKVLIFIFLLILSVIAVLPIIYIINTAFKPLRELFLYPPRFFVMSPTIQNFYDLAMAMQSSIIPFSRFLYNSVVVTAFTVVLTVVISSLCAYPLSKHDFPGKKAVFFIIVISLMFAPEAVSITRYIIIDRINLLNTYGAHILPHIALPVGVFLMKQFVDQIPDSLLEAARIDGASEYYILTNIIIPLSKAAVGTIFILSFQSVWNNVETSNLYMRHEVMKTLPYYIGSLSSDASYMVARAGAAAAGGLLLFLPNFIIFFVLKKSMIDTLVYSGIKGG